MSADTPVPSESMGTGNLALSGDTVASQGGAHPSVKGLAMECSAIGCQHGNAHALIQELRANNTALLNECMHYRRKLRELSTAATAALTVTKS